MKKPKVMFLVIGLLLICGIAFPIEPKIYKCTAGEFKLVRGKLFCRNFSCENKYVDKRIKEFRRLGGLSKVGYGLQQFIEESKHDCPEIWEACYEKINPEIVIKYYC